MTDNTKTLILMRHAKSSWSDLALQDYDRPLNHRGCQDAEVIGEWLSLNADKPDLVLCSSAQRAVQTASLVSYSFDLASSDIEFREDLYLASVSHLHALVTQTLKEVSSLMLIGHNPGLETLLINLCSEVESQANGKVFTTANCAIISISDTMNSELVSLIRPKELCI